MAHELDMSNGRANMAYRGEKPWHGMGQTITAGMSLDAMRKAAGLDWSILELPSLYEFGGKMLEAPNRKMLVRSDTGAYLSQMSENKYDVRQPGDIVEFFRDICDHGGFEIETLGSLFGGAKVWCLAKRKASPKRDLYDTVTGNDKVKPYIMLADSYDGTMATVARFTSVRVVCNNTLRFSERDKATQVKIAHSKKFDADKVKAELGGIDEQFAAYIESMRAFGKVKMSADLRERFLLNLIGGVTTEAKKEGRTVFVNDGNWKRAKVDRDAISTASHNTVQELLRLAEPDNSPGSNVLPGSLYNLLQTVTYHTDHEKRTKGDTRWQSAAFGAGANLKDSAFELALDMVK